MDLVTKQPGLWLSGSLWNNFPLEAIINQKNRNSGYGFYDDFENVGSLTSGSAAPYSSLLTTSHATAAQIAEVTQGDYGLLQLAIDATASNECVIQRGYLGTPFVLNNFDLCFEARLRFSAITASKWSWFLGLAQTDSLTTAHALTTAAAPLVYATDDFVGFWSKAAATQTVSAMYQNGTGTYNLGATNTTGSASGLVDGSVNTALASVATIAATAGSVTNPNYNNQGTFVPNWVNLGFRYYAAPGELKWFVNGTEVTAARLGPQVIANTVPFASGATSYTFPNATLFTPTFAMKNTSGTPAALNVTMEFWACAQAAPASTVIGPDTAPP